jgi:hypothetical protein
MGLHRDEAVFALYFGATRLTWNSIFLVARAENGQNGAQVRAKYGAFPESRSPKTLA